MLEVTISSIDNVKIVRLVFYKSLTEKQKELLRFHATVGHSFECIQDYRIIPITDLIGEFEVEKDTDTIITMTNEFIKQNSRRNRGRKTPPMAMV